MKFFSLLALTAIVLASPVKETKNSLVKRGAVLTAQFASETEVSFLLIVSSSRRYSPDLRQMGELNQIACPEFLWNVHVAVSSWKIIFGARPLLRVVGPITSWFYLLTTGQACKAHKWQPPMAMLLHGIQTINGKAVTSSPRFPSSVLFFW